MAKAKVKSKSYLLLELSEQEVQVLNTILGEVNPSQGEGPTVARIMDALDAADTDVFSTSRYIQVTYGDEQIIVGGFEE